MAHVSAMWSALTHKLAGWLKAMVVALPNLLLAVAILFAAIWIARWMERGASSLLHRLSSNRPIVGLMSTTVRVTTIAVGVFVALGVLNLDKTVMSLLAGVGVIGLALGFAFQDIAANFMSGFLMAFNGPFEVGDLVEVNGRLGRVKVMALRATELETLDGLAILVPNKDVFQNAIVNYNRTPSRRLDFSAGTAYSDDMEKVRAVAIEALQDVKHRDRSRNVELFFESFGDSSINFLVRIWLEVADQRSWLEARSEALIAMKKAFDNEGITIPFPIRTLDFGARVVGGEPLDLEPLRAVRER